MKKYCFIISLLLPQVNAGDLVLIQFGANDGNKSRPERYVHAYRGYSENLRRFISEIRAKNGIPVLVTSPTAHYYNGDGTLRRSWGDYPAAMRGVASDTGAFLIDAEDYTFHRQNLLGKDATVHLFMVSVDGKDTSHFTKEGADIVAEYVAQQLISTGIL